MINIQNYFRWNSWTLYRNEHSEYGRNCFLVAEIIVKFKETPKIKIFEIHLLVCLLNIFSLLQMYFKLACIECSA